ncbi:MAG: tetratricopeptide repeat protein [Peptococcaceae bacterium]|nr:tetratricopeptide repeat protein [Peptococcaceae bacterium]
MNFSVNGKTRNLVFFVLICIGIVCLIVASEIGQQQDAQYTNYYNLYQQANGMIQQGKVADAAPIFSSLLESHPDSYMLMWQYAYCLTEEGKFSEAEHWYTATRLERPFIVNNPQYLYAAALNYANLRELTTAKQYVLRAQTFNNDPTVATGLTTLLNQINAATTKK